MEIEIQSKTNNPLLKRTEVHFIVHHEGESTPKREFVKGELAEKLNVKSENIMINYMKSNFGTTTTLGYAKVYKSLKEAKERERDFILSRNKVIEKEKKPTKEKEKKPSIQPDKKHEETSEEPTGETIEKPVEKKEEEPATEKSDEKKSAENIEKPDSDKKSVEEKK